MRYLIFSLTLILCSCKNELTKDTKNITPVSKHIFPVFIHKTKVDSARYFEEKSIIFCDFYPLGKFNLTDSIFIDSFDVYILKRQRQAWNNHSMYAEEIDTLAKSWKRNGFKLYADHNQTIIADAPKSTSWLHQHCTTYFPFFIYNTTNDTLLITESSLDNNIIQEAFFKGHWYPIENITQYSCRLRVGYAYNYIEPNKTNVFLLPKYKGNYTTHLRIKCDMNGRVLTSNIYTGTIDTNQFYFDKYFKQGIESSCKGMNSDIKPEIKKLFFGDLPLEYAD